MDQPEDVTFTEKPRLRRPAMVCGISGWVDGGEAVSVLPLIFLLVERVNVSVGEGPDMFILKDGEQAVQVAANDVADSKAKASDVLGKVAEILRE